jgi:hypothetical protein
LGGTQISVCCTLTLLFLCFLSFITLFSLVFFSSVLKVGSSFVAHVMHDQQLVALCRRRSRRRCRRLRWYCRLRLRRHRHR